MIGFRVTDVFIDENSILVEVDESEERGLRQFGFQVMQGARSKIIPALNSSPPGNAPSSHTGILQRFIRYSFDQYTGSVYIGPELLKRKSDNVVQALEEGGVSSNVRGHRLYIRRRPFMLPAFNTISRRLLPGVFQDSMKG